MSIVSEFKEISASQIGVAFAVFLATVAPGCLILLHFKPDLLLHLESWKVVIVSGGLTCPLVFWNTFLVWHKHRDSKPLPYSVGYSLVVTSGIIYLALLLAYFAKFQFGRFVVSVAVLEILIISVSQLRHTKAIKEHRPNQSL